MKTKKRITGDIGEEIACRFLVKYGFKIVDQNYLKPWGEIDIIAQKQRNIHFVEVKTIKYHLNVSCETDNYVTREIFRPEENVHSAKLKRLHRAIQTYLSEKHVSHETEWQIDVVTVLLDLETKKAKVEIIENVIL